MIRRRTWLALSAAVLTGVVIWYGLAPEHPPRMQSFADCDCGGFVMSPALSGRKLSVSFLLDNIRSSDSSLIYEGSTCACISTRIDGAHCAPGTTVPYTHANSPVLEVDVDFANAIGERIYKVFVSDPSRPREPPRGAAIRFHLYPQIEMVPNVTTFARKSFVTNPFRTFKFKFHSEKPRPNVTLTFDRLTAFLGAELKPGGPSIQQVDRNVWCHQWLIECGIRDVSRIPYPGYSGTFSIHVVSSEDSAKEHAHMDVPVLIESPLPVIIPSEYLLPGHHWVELPLMRDDRGTFAITSCTADTDAVEVQTPLNQSAKIHTVKLRRRDGSIFAGGARLVVRTNSTDCAELTVRLRSQP
jgi:hypothetical protein